MPDNQKLKELLTDMRMEVAYSHIATMPIPLYERMKAVIKELADKESQALYVGHSNISPGHCRHCSEESIREVCLDCEYPIASTAKKELRERLAATQQALDTAVEALEEISTYCSAIITGTQAIARAALTSIGSK